MLALTETYLCWSIVFLIPTSYETRNQNMDADQENSELDQSAIEK